MRRSSAQVKIYSTIPQSSRFVQLDMDTNWPVELLRRQYLQLMSPDMLTLPSSELRSPQMQSDIYESVFNQSNSRYPPAERYRFRVLKKIVTALEEAVEDPEEDVGISSTITLLIYLFSHLFSRFSCTSTIIYLGTDAHVHFH